MPFIRRATVIPVLAALILLPIWGVLHRSSTPSMPAVDLQPPEPVRVEWRIAVVSEDDAFLSELSRALVAREVKVLPVRRAAEAAGYDLVVLGWDALPIVSADGELVAKLLRSGRLLVAAKPGTDALELLFSRIVGPVKLGAKGVEEQPVVAFFPVCERGGEVKPCSYGANLLIIETWELKDGRLGASYRSLSFRSEGEAGRAILELLSFRVEEHKNKRLNFQLTGASSFVQQIEQWTHIGSWWSINNPINGRIGRVGSAWVTIQVAYCTSCQDPQYPSVREWLIFVEGHHASTWNGYSLPVRVLGSWVIEPNTVIVDIRTSAYPDQRITFYSPVGSGTNGQISITIRYPPGITYTNKIPSQVTHQGTDTTTYSSYYGGHVISTSLWRWGLTSYEGRGGIGYHMGGYAKTAGLVPLYFTVKVKANAYLYIGRAGIVDIATSGERSFSFAAYTDRLEFRGGG